MIYNSSWAPDEPPDVLYAEKTWLQGALLSNIVYGVELALFIMCFKLLVRQMDRTNRRRHLILLVFISVLFILGTIFVYSLSEFTQLAFIEQRNFPGGPSAYENDMFWIPVDELGVAVWVIGNWLMDLLLVWRCIVIFSALPGVPIWAVVVLPSILFCASFSLGVLFLVKTSHSSPYGSPKFTIIYFATTLALNVMVTVFIATRLLYYQRRARTVFGGMHLPHYSNLASILVESAALYSIFSILFVVPLALNNPLGSVFLQALGQVQTVSSLLIIYRVARGRSFPGDESVQLSTTQRSAPEIRLGHMPSVRSSIFDMGNGVKGDTHKEALPNGGVMVTHEVISDESRSVV
ncbi:predicted protein [Postia placenta Mad-698-R]|nr:predicted protein [Postia placenta Mad-698-R]